MTEGGEQRMVDLLTEISGKLTHVIEKLDELQGADRSAQINTTVRSIETLLRDHFGGRWGSH
jgi:hypothetical protein